MSEETLVHASCVALDGRAALILGASGAGKSSLALRLMALGAVLVADDQVCLRREGDKVLASCSEPLAGMIEARGIGLLAAEPLAEAEIVLIVDLDQTELHRLPPQRYHDLLGISVNTVLGRDNPVLDVGVFALLKGARVR